MELAKHRQKGGTVGRRPPETKIVERARLPNSCTLVGKTELLAGINAPAALQSLAALRPDSGSTALFCPVTVSGRAENASCGSLALVRLGRAWVSAMVRSAECANLRSVFETVLCALLTKAAHPVTTVQVDRGQVGTGIVAGEHLVGLLRRDKIIPFYSDSVEPFEAEHEVAETLFQLSCRDVCVGVGYLRDFVGCF